jgi:hypothetical protein
MSPDAGTPGNGLLLFFRVDDFDSALQRARALVTRFEEETSRQSEHAHERVLAPRSGWILRHDKRPRLSAPKSYGAKLEPKRSHHAFVLNSCTFHIDSHSTPDQHSSWQSEIASVEHDANRAFLDRDLARLDELFSDDLVVNSPINLINDKKKILELLGKGIIGHVSSTIHHELSAAIVTWSL